MTREEKIAMCNAAVLAMAIGLEGSSGPAMLGRFQAFLNTLADDTPPETARIRTWRHPAGYFQLWVNDHLVASIDAATAAAIEAALQGAPSLTTEVGQAT